MGSVTELSADELRIKLANWTENQFVLVDVREAQEYAAGHLPGAVHIPLFLSKETTLHRNGNANEL